MVWENFLALACGLPGSLLASLSAFNVASMTLSVASFVTVSKALSFVKTTSSSTQTIALFHAVTRSQRMFSKVSAIWRKFPLSSSSRHIFGIPGSWFWVCLVDVLCYLVLFVLFVKPQEVSWHETCSSMVLI